jgi:hypothetical protein
VDEEDLAHHHLTLGAEVDAALDAVPLWMSQLRASISGEPTHRLSTLPEYPQLQTAVLSNNFRKRFKPLTRPSARRAFLNIAVKPCCRVLSVLVALHSRGVPGHM